MNFDSALSLIDYSNWLPEKKAGITLVALATKVFMPKMMPKLGEFTATMNAISGFRSL